jgi:ABC-type Fe3+ transport system permease subunit
MREMAYLEKMKNRMLVGAVVIAVILLVLLALLFINYRKVQEQNRQLYAKSLGTSGKTKCFSTAPTWAAILCYPFRTMFLLAGAKIKHDLRDESSVFLEKL